MGPFTLINAPNNAALVDNRPCLIQQVVGQKLFTVCFTVVQFFLKSRFCQPTWAFSIVIQFNGLCTPLQPVVSVVMVGYCRVRMSRPLTRYYRAGDDTNKLYFKITFTFRIQGTSGDWAAFVKVGKAGTAWSCEQTLIDISWSIHKKAPSSRPYCTWNQGGWSRDKRLTNKVLHIFTRHNSTNPHWQQNIGTGAPRQEPRS